MGRTRRGPESRIVNRRDFAMEINSIALPPLSEGLTRYLTEIRKFPMLLTPDEEISYARSWRERGDRQKPHTVWSPATCAWSLRSPCAIAVTGCPLRISCPKETSA